MVTYWVAYYPDMNTPVSVGSVAQYYTSEITMKEYRFFIRFLYVSMSGCFRLSGPAGRASRHELQDEK